MAEGGRVAVVTDSAADLPPGRAAGVTVVPLTVTFGDESFLDGPELSAEAFWARVAEGKDFPTTASPSPDALHRAYRAAADAGAGAVVSVHLSGALSRAVESARQAADRSPIPVEVVDSGSVCMGQGMVVQAAAHEAEGGGTLTRVVEVARSAAARLAVVAVLDGVELLKRGGRLGRARAALSDLLRIRPVLALESGEPVLVARARTRARAIEEALDRVAGPAEAVAVFHAGAREAEMVAGRLEHDSGVTPEVGLIGAVTGTHLGPRALGVAVLRPPETAT